MARRSRWRLPRGMGHPRAWAWACRASACLLAALPAACQRHADPSHDVGSPATPPPSEALPPLSLNDSSPNLLLTWVGDDGDFHVVERIDGVPAEHRKQVRVVQTDRSAGTGVVVYVADLEQKRADGSYAVTTLPRAEWEKLGADRRKTRLEQVAPGAAPAAGAGGQAPVTGEAQAANEPSAPSAVSAIVYGADWCKPCHDAERYLRSLGVAVTKKNIEESRAAQAEMREKLTRVNRTGAGIPVIDVMGKIFVGYSPGPLKQAVDA
ncbi:MAG TPA: glutaredoxin domain-containing protein, partial [Polyangiaceae bacterium]|nr:glutaredoxin domain-containing protein [Polyangiaceae bacterium]